MNIIVKYLATIGLALIGKLVPSLKSFLVNFIKSDVGTLAKDAVAYAETLTGATGVEKRDAAVAKLKEDLASAGHDVSEFSASLLNMLIESALQAVVLKLS
ncbi:phage holin, LLH family [Terriglobus roseus]|uniref:Bacteriophage holin of superfamily 6 (Holin_LLH) n=1 Tax=Terriglobus roseus TaxID=392734 RepID=A0A1G7G5B8_9BACT|nr:phage holin, LLH family [Terriglobus roseus]SDE83303.1 Bacteriophage holin of superfamily 6 (Holin_LLH) [Terriglobus roseus]